MSISTHPRSERPQVEYSYGLASKLVSAVCPHLPCSRPLVERRTRYRVLNSGPKENVIRGSSGTDALRSFSTEAWRDAGVLIRRRWKNDFSPKSCLGIRPTLTQPRSLLPALPQNVGPRRPEP